ncbi:hypothetical protein [Pseudomonas syringae group genomosp. 3]|uniref:hypothetical protein n=1 Tax=Pseudomonas syringae group genomosp. 3 TaxID=251701 RepID=UPI0005C86A5C|nr:hypothetical protein [Pseudomonas syringae group genomosp. 3]
MIRVHLSLATRLAVACVAVFSVNSPTNAKLSADHVPTRIVSSWQGLPSLDLAVCANPFVFPESDKTNVLKALLGEDDATVRVASR